MQNTVIAVVQAKSSTGQVLRVAAAQGNEHVLRLILKFQSMPEVLLAIKGIDVLPMAGRVSAELLQQFLSLGASCNSRDPVTGGTVVHKVRLLVYLRCVLWVDE